MNWPVKKAKQILKKYGFKTIDFSLEDLLAKLKLEVYETDLGRIKEVYFRDLRAIVVNPKIHHYQKRRVVAHALGHHLLHECKKANYFLSKRDDPLNWQKLMIKEREADVFASHLLIPGEKLDPLLKEDWIKESENPISALAEEFQVPQDLMKKRIEFRELFK